MALPWLAQDTIKVWAPERISTGYGDAVRHSWSQPILVEEIEGCSVQPQNGTEFTVEREAITFRWMVFVPDHHPLLLPTHRVEIPYEAGLLAIDGPVLYFPDPTGMELDHHLFYLKEIKG